ncbi:glycosyltransferase family 39 protein [Flavobacterium celericrescens]|uniref:Glycosyltransferase RgtA/B/C/D-like domain-containing protein n=1 Tax=Flavobacterium celericrescens TaxID=2709780 RepID=A0ABX0I8U0_9FLAO|nr:glycosyltransferase family 39 protein [Flavobacterium celericrescens]NHM03424.1 hypothetical protein [Flavobacterium celericrescens]
MNLFSMLKNNYWLFSILLLSSILRFYHIDFQSIWLDEIHTMNESNPNTKISDLYGAIMAGEQMPPLYFYSLYFIFKIFGYTTLVARLFSAILGVISIFALYKFSKELFNKKVALIASFLLSINSFHLYYSQEARPYILLFLFSILSFYGLVRYIKISNFKNAIIYGSCTGLMLLSHFFGLFVFFSQLFVLLFFFLISKKNNMLDFFKKSLFSCIIVLILFIPALKIFIKVTEIKEFWIPAPTVDVYTLIFREFFGNSEIVLSLLGIFILLYFIKLSKTNHLEIKYNNIVENKMLFSFIILLPWISLVLLIPLIRSYVSVPMIISRYFIVVLPAILLIISVGITQFKNKIIQYAFILMLFIFTISDIVFVKNYYFNTTKSQFREGSNFIIENNSNKTKVVTSLGWYFKYFLQNKKVNYELIDKSLDNYVDEIKLDTTKIQAFWYIDAHGRIYNPTQTTIDFLDKYFYVEKNLNAHDVWVKKYELKTNKPKIDISKLNFKIKQSIIESNIEVFENKDNKFIISGWAYVKGIESKDNILELFLVNDSSQINIESEQIIRKDITSFFKDHNTNYDMSGFQSQINLDNIPKGNYKLAIYVANSNKKIEEIKLTDLVIKN